MLFLLTWVVFGWGYILLLIVSERSAQLCAVVTVFIFFLFAGFNPTLSYLSSLDKFFQYIPYFSYARYFIEIIYLYELKKLGDITNVNVSLEIFSYEWGDKYYIRHLVVVYDSNHYFQWGRRIAVHKRYESVDSNADNIISTTTSTVVVAMTVKLSQQTTQRLS